MSDSQDTVTRAADGAHRESAMRAALYAEVAPIQKIVLVALAERLGTDDVARAPITHLVDVTGVGEADVRVVLSTLARRGWISPAAPDAWVLSTALLGA